MIYVGIVTYNSKKDMRKCLSAVLNQSNQSIKTIVYDNFSNDGISVWLKKHFPNVSYVQGNQNIGFGRAHNHIIQSCNMRRGDWYLSLNPDVVLHQEYVQHIISAAQNHKIDWATGKLLLTKKGGQLLYSTGHALHKDGFCVNIGQGMKATQTNNHITEVFGAPGAAALYSYKMIQAISKNKQFYDPNMFMYSEDIDVDWRARLAQLHCWYVPLGVAYHRGGSPSPLLCAHSIVNRYLSVTKNAFLADLLLYNAPLIILHFLFRLLTTPYWGFWMMRRFFHYLPYAINNRTKPKIHKKTMHAWFQWGAKQKSIVSSSRANRLKSFFKNN